MNHSPRTLPIGLAPIQHETLGSFLCRLADANRLAINTLSNLVIGRTWAWRRDSLDCPYWTDSSTEVLGALTNRTTRSLAQGLHLEAITPASPITADITYPPLLRPACRFCIARHGIHSIVICRITSNYHVCQRHARWLTGSHQQHLDRLPQVVQANRHHRRLAQQQGISKIETAYSQARAQTFQWFQRAQHDELQQRWTERYHRLPEDAYGDPRRPSEDQTELITYPETLVLTGLLCSPF